LSLPTGIAVGSVISSSAAGSGGDDFITVNPWGLPGPPAPSYRYWDVTVRDADGGNEDAWFYLVLL
jgi:hypothetical protein